MAKTTDNQQGEVDNGVALDPSVRQAVRLTGDVAEEIVITDAMIDAGWRELLCAYRSSSRPSIADIDRDSLRAAYRAMVAASLSCVKVKP